MIKKINDWIKSNWKKKVVSKWVLYKVKQISKRYKKGQNLFIDCGSNIGQGFNYFKNHFSLNNHDFILIEPNPNCFEKLKEFKSSKVQILNKGVWSEVTKIKLFGISESNDDLTQGGSLIKNHNKVFYDVNEDEGVLIDTISLSSLILDNKDNYDNIIVKLDIESSEYEVLKSLISENSIQYVNHIFVEFHSNYFKEEKAFYKNLEGELAKKIKSNGVGLTRWG